MKAISRIKKKIALKGVQLNPALSEQYVAAFEDKIGVKLPQGFRLFLLHAGDGGEGPIQYGIDRLSTLTPSDQLMLPFPFVDFWVWEGQVGPIDKARQQSVSQGNLRLGHDGCGIYWHLIITGAERGQMWQFTEYGIQPCCPRRDFLSWYEFWLDGNDDWWADFDYSCRQ